MESTLNDDYYESLIKSLGQLENDKKLYGIDPGCIRDTDRIEKMSELELFLEITNLYHEYSRNKYIEENNVSVLEVQCALEFMMYQTRKFGVQFSKPIRGKHIMETPSYKAWFTFYDNYLRSFTLRDWNNLITARNNGSDLSEFAPNGSWEKELEVEEVDKAIKKKQLTRFDRLKNIFKK